MKIPLHMLDTGNIYIMILMRCIKHMTVMYTGILISVLHMTDTQSDDNLLVRHMDVARHIKHHMAICLLKLIFHKCHRG